MEEDNKPAEVKLKEAVKSDEEIAKELGNKDSRLKIVLLVAFAILVTVFLAYLLLPNRFHKEDTVVMSTSQAKNALSSLSSELKDSITKLNASFKAIQHPTITNNANSPASGIATPPGNNALIGSDLKARYTSPMQIPVNSIVTKPVAQTNQNLTSGLAQTDETSSFANSQANLTDTVKPVQLANTDKTIVQGEFLPAVLTVAISSELPGMVEAITSRAVYSYTGNNVLIPKGSRLVGQFMSSRMGDAATSRLFIIWNRIITPSGLSIALNSASVDLIGRSGQGADYINSHFWQIFGTASLLSIIGAGTATYGDNNNNYNSQEAYRSAIASSFANSSNKLLSNRLNIGPTLYINQGTTINVFVAHDILFN